MDIKQLLDNARKEHSMLASIFSSTLIHYVNSNHKPCLLHDVLLEDKDVESSLKKFTDGLRAHLKTEDELFYPLLAKIEDPEVRENSLQFCDGLLGISKRCYAFMDEYSDYDISQLDRTQEFKIKLMETTHIVLDRVRIEEEILFPVCEKYYKI